MAIRASGITDTSTVFAIDGGGAVKQGPTDVICGIPLTQNELRRGIFVWDSTVNYGASNTTEAILGHYRLKTSAGAIIESIGTNVIITQSNGMHVWFKVKVITTFETGAVVVSGDSIAEDGTVTTSDTENITITNTANKWYTTTKRWEGQIKIDGDNPLGGTMSITLDAGFVDPYSHFGLMRVLEGYRIKWIPDNATWSIDVNIFKWTNGTSGGRNQLATFPRSFANTDAVPRAQLNKYGHDWHAQIDEVIDPTDNEGYIVELDIIQCGRIHFQTTFYQY